MAGTNRKYVDPKYLNAEGLIDGFTFRVGTEAPPPTTNSPWRKLWEVFEREAKLMDAKGRELGESDKVQFVGLPEELVKAARSSLASHYGEPHKQGFVVKSYIAVGGVLVVWKVRLLAEKQAAGRDNKREAES